MQDYSGGRDDRGTAKAVIEVRLRLGAERRTAEKLATILEAIRRDKLNIFTPTKRRPPTSRYLTNAGGRVALRLHLAALVPELGPLPATPHKTAGLPPAGYRVRSTALPHGCMEPLRSYESPDDVFVLVVGSRADHRYTLAGWCYGWDIRDGALARSEVKPMNTLPLLSSTRAA